MPFSGRHATLQRGGRHVPSRDLTVFQDAQPHLFSRLLALIGFPAGRSAGAARGTGWIPAGDRSCPMPPSASAGEPRPRRSCDRTVPLRRRQESAQPSDCDSAIVRTVLKREHRVNVAFQLPPGTIATSIGRHTFGDLFRSAGAGWIGRGSDVLEWCRYARCCDTLCRHHAARVDGLRRGRRLPGQR